MFKKTVDRVITIRKREEWNLIELLLNPEMKFKARVEHLNPMSVRFKYFLDENEALKWAEGDEEQITKGD